MLLQEMKEKVTTAVQTDYFNSKNTCANNIFLFYAHLIFFHEFQISTLILDGY